MVRPVRERERGIKISSRLVLKRSARGEQQRAFERSDRAFNEATLIECVGMDSDLIRDRKYQLSTDPPLSYVLSD
jgi:hypothetical protein